MAGYRLNFTFFNLKVPRQCPLVLLVKDGWRQGRTLGSEEGKDEGRGYVMRKELSIWAEKNVKVLLCPAPFIC
jgi:hypothetical protein